MDAVQAHVWLNIAAASGYEDAREVKKLVAKTMSATEISKAQDSARQCVQNDYKVCWRTKQLHSTPTPLTKDKPPMQLNEKLLKNLLKKGIIDESEFKILKAKLIAK